MMLLAINWAAVSVQVGQLLLALSILIVLHEFGHYITARWFGCRVEKFFLFFDPWFALVKKKVGETTYGIGWLPLGGYVKISGMIDESMDKEAMKQPAQPYEFRSKPAWQRLIIMLGGIIMNVLVAFVVYAFVLMIWGETKTPMKSLKYGIWTQDTLMNQIGLRNGDKIISVNGKPVDYLENLSLQVLLGKEIVLERDGKQVDLKLPINLIEKLVESRKRKGGLLDARIPAYVGEFNSKVKILDSAYAKQAGLKEMDRIIAVDSVPVQFYDEIEPLVTKHKNGSVTIAVDRNGDTLQLVSRVNGEGKIGLPFLKDEQYEKLGVYTAETRKYGFFAAFPAGVMKTGEKLQGYIDQFKMILNPKTGAYKGVGGFKAIGSVFPTTWSWEAFWNITAFLSIILAFMNLLPIPALDGGHVMFTLYEMISGRKPNEKFLEYAQMVGMVLLLGLMLYANGNDWFGWGRG
ncbi:RIP metalloprotease RseP [Terrimonas sp. NA20]|uniref:Zinc metalloprotease n=1 Tax=Terrimonas ginsenosidimutans TaxID=2908004 RepID=A0ABS9KWT6_9BACT|nr:RIP metalloprotease RseP [Terrimonas ginsenosidimutans]MCG2616778.1 RIP metalloprotease RseP [Terrimonas ginsenosidimutans]